MNCSLDMFHSLLEINIRIEFEGITFNTNYWLICKIVQSHSLSKQFNFGMFYKEMCISYTYLNLCFYSIHLGIL